MRYTFALFYASLPAVRLPPTRPAMQDLRSPIEAAWENRELLKKTSTQQAINAVIEALDKGRLRVAEPTEAGNWQVNDWVKKAVVLYFPIRQMETIEVGPFEFHDKMELKRDYANQGVRVVPHAIARYGAFLESGVIMMPSYVNIGAWVGSGTMVDTWATVGSCAQVGRNVHLSGGVGLGGVLEPLQATPTVIEDDCFIGSRSIVVEGGAGAEGSGTRGQRRAYAEYPHHRRDRFGAGNVPGRGAGAVGSNSG